MRTLLFNGTCGLIGLAFIGLYLAAKSQGPLTVAAGLILFPIAMHFLFKRLGFTRGIFDDAL